MKRPWLALTAGSFFLVGALAISDRAPVCDGDNGGITLPAGFCATIFADYAGVSRHIVVSPLGQLFVTLGDGTAGGTSKIARVRPVNAPPGLLILSDQNGDGRSDREQRVPVPELATGIALSSTHVFLSTRTAVVRYRLAAEAGVVGPPDTVISGFPVGGHNSKALALDDRGGLFVSVGSNTNACRLRRTDSAPDPCPELSERAGIWRYGANRLRQAHPRDGEAFAVGIRNGIAMSWNARQRALYSLSHGRDGLSTLFPALFSAEKNAETPAEEFARVERGDDWGWPYCYHDRELNKKVLAPEYGGDGNLVGRCANTKAPLIAFPGHWGPNALAFYEGTAFPERYHGGAFVAFHGSWNRMPLPEQGYNVVFAEFRNTSPTGKWEVFASGFARDTLEPVLATHRPTGLAVAPDGALFITDDQRGRIWRVTYSGARH